LRAAGLPAAERFEEEEAPQGRPGADRRVVGRLVRKQKQGARRVLDMAGGATGRVLAEIGVTEFARPVVSFLAKERSARSHLARRS
jgi:hypothetical protein